MSRPLRQLKGDRTKLATPHGIAIDVENQLLFVNNWGQALSFTESPVINACCRQQPVETGNLGSGRFEPPSLTVLSARRGWGHGAVACDFRGPDAV